MKTLIKILSITLFLLAIFWISFAQHGKWGNWWSDPMQIFNTFVDSGSNEWNYNIHETALDWVTDQQWWYARSFKITNTLDYIRIYMDPYLQRTIYAGLVLAVVALIYLWFLLVTGWLHKEWDRSKIKSKVMYIVVGVFLLSWFYFIIKVMVALVTSLFGWSTWDSGY
jgi:hypothetical protein